MAELRVLSASRDAGGRIRTLLDEHKHRIYVQTDRLFAVLMGFQWLASVAAAVWIAPRTWAGRSSEVHVHLWAAVFLGALICGFPAALAIVRPGAAVTRYVIATAQMLVSALLIHLCGGRIETHFHVFGSLAFLAFYRDWRVLVPATAVVALDHMIRGLYYPESVFGVLGASQWRWLEHAAWVVFEDVILVKSCLRSQLEMWGSAARQVRLEEGNQVVELQVKERTASLAKREAMLHAVVSNASESIVVSNSAGEIIAFNPMAEQTFGWRAMEAIGQPLTILMPECYHHDHTAGMNRFLATGKPRVIGQKTEMTGLRRDGVEFPLELSISAWSVAGRTYFTAMIRDVTERKQAEIELWRAKETAEAANRAKSEFLANMSHEIRTPMNGVIGMTELALGTDLTPEQREYLHTVKYSAESLLTIINDILDFSKIEAGKFTLDPIDFDLRVRVGQSVKTLGAPAVQKGLELAYDVAEDVPPHLIGDAIRLNQIVMNLVGNAIKFTERGEVVVRVSVDTAETDAVTLHFAISDTGIGIAEEKIKAIFEPFTQADASTTRRFGGTGLGLSISRALVELMDGRLWVESEVGKGTTFHFTARLGYDPQAAPPAHPSALRDLRALVVDDNETNRRILTRLLGQWEMKPTTVSGAEEAMTALRQARQTGETFGILVVDCHMPVTDGFMLVEQARTIGALSKTPVLMLTSSGQGEDVRRCRDIGIDAHLLKPVLQADLQDAVLRLLGAAQPQGLQTPAAASDGARRLRILLAEDNLVNQRVAVRLLEKQGHFVAVAHDGQQALDRLNEEEFDLILMDVQMPVMDGLKATAAIREAETQTGGRIPIIAMTAFAMQGDRERFLESGMDQYVSKPLNFQELLATMHEVLHEGGRAGRNGVTEPTAP